MAVREDILALLRQELGKGFETAPFAVMAREYVLWALRPKLLALYRSRLDETALVDARKAAEAALAQEIEQRKLNDAGVMGQLDNDLQGF